MEGRRRFPYRFFVVTFLWSWVLCLPLVLAGSGIVSVGRDLLSTITIPILVLAGFGPAVGALYSLSTLDGRGAVCRYLRGLLDLRFGWRVWILPVLVSGGITCAAWILPETWGEPRLGLRLQSPRSMLFYFVIMLLIGGGQEELGWRGYILDPIEERLGPWLGNAVLGVVWAVWHLPLFLIPGSGQDVTPPVAFVLFTTGLSWFFAWVRQASKKRTSSGLYAHAWVNVFGTVFPTTVMAPGGSQTRYWIWASLAFVVGLVATAARGARVTGASAAGYVGS
jgi:membrane protease YdiL (CAAX protease family)